MRTKKPVLILLSLALSLACQPKVPPVVVPERADLLEMQHTLQGKAVPLHGKLSFERDRLPDGTRGKFASYDGDNFVVNFPPKQADRVSSDDVFGNFVAPVMRGMGFGARVEEMGRPRNEGTTLPRANLAGLAMETCREVQGERYQRFHPVCEALMKGSTNEIAERVLQLAYGMSVAQFRADIERVRIQYVFPQLVQQTPIEHAGVIATRLEGETVTALHGLLFNRYRVTNDRKLSIAEALDAGYKRLYEFKNIAPIEKREQFDTRADLVLLPYGGASDASGEVAALRFAYRTLLMANPARGPRGRGHYLSWMAWIDAETGDLLQLSPQFNTDSATVPGWKRDPNTPAQSFFVQVDAPPSGGQYTLTRAGVFNRFDRLGDGDFNDSEVSIAAGSSNFNVAPLNDAANAICANSSNLSFRQLNAYAHTHSYRETLVNAGTFPPFPEQAVTVWIDSPSGGNSANYDALGMGQSLLDLVAGATFSAGTCPDAAGSILPGATDPTSMLHEFTHISALRMTDRRPSNWCGMAPCALPLPGSHYSLHDFADAFAQAYASTPCQAGFSRKNSGGIDAAENCATHVENGGLPRLASVTEPFSTANIRDHFPEARPATAPFGQGHQDGQLPAAALWQVRQGMRSKCLPSGTPQYWVRLSRSLYNYGFLMQTCTTCTTINCQACDRDIYRYMQDMARQMSQQWATAGQPGGPPEHAHNGAHTTNKLLAGWARVGVFLIPFGCIDGDNATTDPTFCPGGEIGGDAIVDVFDNDAGDDVTIDQIVHPEYDWAERGGALPTFRVWTGPRYKFDASGVARSYTPSMATPSPCHPQFQVELASNPTFTTNFVSSGWQNVSTTTQPECYGTWQPSAANWTTLSGTTGDVRVYYRVRTRDASMGNEKISTSPGSGSYTVPPSYIVVNNAGQP